ncbi:phosphoglycerate kinase [Candidatus Peregrinibacteria bacterium]|nr:phosphoglycerate kinase [Candidatus Peregrinibacteria bacterium]
MLRTLKHIKNLKGKRVLLRVDFNVPIDKRGVTDDTRIRETLPTIKFLLRKKAKVIVMTHLGRPEGHVVDSLKLDAVAACLKKLLGKKVEKLHNCVGKAVEAAVKKMKEGEIFLLENIRFHPEEEACDPKFVKALAKLGDIFVNDAFAACHRKHASVYGVAKHLPAYAGFLVEREIKFLTPLLSKFAKPLTLVVGGAKVDTKIGLLKNFFGKADYILIGGALANTFLAAEGFDIGKSLFEPNKLETARELLMLAEKRGQHIVLPHDAIVADEVTEYAKTLDLPLEDIEGNMKILDVGSKTRGHFTDIIKASKTVIWNGPMGLYEFTPFASGTKAVAQTLAGLKGKTKTYVGGGDTIDALKRCNIQPKKFTFVSTGGGAMLEFLEGKKLPGIEVLMR